MMYTVHKYIYIYIYNMHGRTHQTSAAQFNHASVHGSAKIVARTTEAFGHETDRAQNQGHTPYTRNTDILGTHSRNQI